MRHVWVSLPYATFGIQVKDNVVTHAAPIAKWMIGKPWRPTVRDWIVKKRGIWKVLPDDLP